MFFQEFRYLIEGFVAAQTAVLAGGNEDALLGEGLLLDIDLPAVTGGNHLFDGQFILAGKLMVALVVTGHRHQRTSAVIHKHKVGDPDRNLFLCERVHRLEASIDAALLHGGQFGLRGLAVSALFDKLSHIAMALCRLFGQRMLCGHGHIAYAHQGVGACGINGQTAVTVFKREGQLGAFRLADPVALHGLDLLGPVL